MKGTNELDFSSPSLRELYQAQGVPGPAAGHAGLCWGREEIQGLGGEEEQAVVTHRVNGSGKAGAPRAAEQEWLRALALGGWLPRGHRAGTPHKRVLECSHHNLSSHGFTPGLKSRQRQQYLRGESWMKPLSPRD